MPSSWASPTKFQNPLSQILLQYASNIQAASVLQKLGDCYLVFKWMAQTQQDHVGTPSALCLSVKGKQKFELSNRKAYSSTEDNVVKDIYNDTGNPR